MTDLTSRITAALDEQQRLAEAALDVADGNWEAAHGHEGWMTRSADDYNVAVYIAEELALFAAANDPSSVLRRVAAQRRVLERHYRDGECCVGCGRGEYGDYRELFVQCPELLDLALGVGVDVTGVEP